MPAIATTFPVSLSVLALASALPALADIEARSTIEAVTVTPDAAQVSRVTEVDLPAGAATLVFKGLPMAMDLASLRIEGESDRLAIGSVETRVVPAEGKTPDTAIEGRLKTLRSEREGWQATVDALDAKRAMIVRFSQSGPDKLSEEAKPLDIAQWGAAWDTVGAGLAKVGDELRSARGRAREIDDEIRALEVTRQRPALYGAPQREVMVAIEAATAAKSKITLTYRIAGAGWRPLYDARLDTGQQTKKPSLDLVRYAAIVQQTGEDWVGVALAVSTLPTNRSTIAPDVQPQKIDFYEAQPVPLARTAPASDAARMKAGPSAQQEAQDAQAVAAGPPILRKSADEVASMESNNYQALFHVAGRISVPSDGSQKRFLISKSSVAPSLTLKTSPALDQTAYLEAHFVNEAEAPLLAGEVAIHRDGAFVGTGRLGFVAPGEQSNLGFGPDDRVKVTRVPVMRKENEPTWLGSTKIETREFKTTVKNLHDFPIRISVVDQMPFSENAAIVVEQLPLTTPPTDRSVADKRGVIGWTYDVASAESKDIRLAYRMKWPADRDVTFQSVPLPH